MKVNSRVLQWMRRLRRNLLAVWFACRHPGTPLLAKVLAVVVAGYAFSPIDLIPDFIPFVGYLDEFVLLPGAIYLIFRLIPQPVLDDCYADADRFLSAHKHTPRSYLAGGGVVLLWVVLLWWLWTQFGTAVTEWFRAAMD